jgi:uncharacterized membrane protein YraQ (UPF0718 family)
LGKAQKSPFLKALNRATVSFAWMLPILFGVILLLGLINAFILPRWISQIFVGNPIQDTVIGAMIGSIAAGNPINSYIIGGELLKRNVTLFAVTAFIVAWVTVGIVQLPAEASFLGRRFAVARNAISFALAMVVAIATVLILAISGG